MAGFRPAAPFNVAFVLLIPTEKQTLGATVKTMAAPEENARIFGSFRTFGGTERVQDGVTQLLNTATIDTWFRPDITAECQLRLEETGDVYDVIGEPEDIDRRHQYLRIKVQKCGGRP